MKTAKFGTVRSVAVMGMIYLLALVLAPAPGVAAPADQPSPGALTGAVGLETARSVCPYSHLSRHSMARALELHQTMLARCVEMPPMSAWGTSRPRIL